ncbi:TIGR00730 family Rossman fold protein [Paraneptunicella aestuarii]|uniref:LOG family protein n=1 Tax=Paraneptunicella aestuarii TaxID=2831148 RepID=UPI001E5E223A|nr:TIGR00730 family Rossman fold protein [Paraneptunicella aestuarii]UAA37720.1 TIGR00730 family Rossman fold protein [Paraneptunicella aestuarii]
MKRICVYCGSSPGNSPIYYEAAKALAHELVERGFGLVYGGASIGVMGKIANAVLENGGEVIGVIPQALVDKEVSHHGLTELKIVSSMHERKAAMADYADGFIALPGGLGTFEELFEVLTWAQLGFHQKPIGVLNVQGYYDKLSQFVDHAVEQGFMKQAHRDMMLMADDASCLLDLMRDYVPLNVEKLIHRDET